MAKKKTYVICFINQKGGVGKTTTTVQTAAYLTDIGKKVLMIDLDAQGNLTLNMDFNTTDANTICELLLSEASFPETVIKTKCGDLIPADDSIAYRELEISGKMGRESLLKIALQPYLKEYDYILLDCPPAINTITYNALNVATDVVLVVNAGAFSAQGCGKMISKINEFSKFASRKINIAGVLFNQYNQTVIAKNFSDEMAELVKKYGTTAIKSKIGKYVAVEESQALKQSLFEYCPNDKVTLQFKEAIEEIILLLKGE